MQICNKNVLYVIWNIKLPEMEYKIDRVYI